MERDTDLFDSLKLNTNKQYNAPIEIETDFHALNNKQKTCKT